MLSHGAQERHRQGAGTHTRFDDRGPGEDVRHLDDLAGVLGVDDGGAAGHRHDVVAEQGPKGEILDASRVRDDGAVRRSDEVVVAQVAAVGVELAARLEGDCVQSPLGVGQLHSLTDLEGAAPMVRCRALGRVCGPGGVGHGSTV